MKANDQFFIFSVQLKSESEKVNKMKHNLAQKIMTGEVPFKNIDGFYDGFTEHSYLVPAQYESKVFELAEASNQESVLFVDNMRNAYLIFLDDGKARKLDGKFQRVDRDRAHQLTAFTRCPETNTYWGVL